MKIKTEKTGLMRLSLDRLSRVAIMNYPATLIPEIESLFRFQMGMWGQD